MHFVRHSGSGGDKAMPAWAGYGIFDEHLYCTICTSLFFDDGSSTGDQWKRQHKAQQHYYIDDYDDIDNLIPRRNQNKNETKQN